MTELKLTLDNEEVIYNLPDGWEDISVNTFAKLYSKDISDLHPIRQSVIYISILSGIEEDTLYDLSPSDFNLLSEQFSFMDTEIGDELNEAVEVDGEKYFIRSDFSSFTYGEQASIEITLEQNGNEIMKCMDKILCIFLRKKDEDGNLEKFNTSFMDRADTFGKIPVAQIYSLFTFFLNTNEQFLTNTVTS